MMSEEEYRQRKESIRLIELDKETTQRDKVLLDEYFLEWTRQEYIKENKSAHIRDGWLYGGMYDMYAEKKELEGRSYKVVNVAINEETGEEVLFGSGSRRFELNARWLKNVRLRMVKQVCEIVGIKKKRLRREHYTYECGVVGRLIQEGSLKGLEDYEILTKFSEYGLGIPREYRTKEIKINVDNIGVDKEKMLYLLKSPIAILQSVTKVSHTSVMNYYTRDKEGLTGQNRTLVKVFGTGTPEGFRSYLSEWTENEKEIIKVLMEYKDKGIEWCKVRKHLMQMKGIDIRDSRGVDMMVVFSKRILKYEGVREDVVIDGLTLKPELLEGIKSQLEYMVVNNVIARMEGYMQEVRGREAQEAREEREEKERIERRIGYIEEHDPGDIWCSGLVKSIIEWYREKGSISVKQKTLVDRFYTELKGVEYKEVEDEVEISYRLQDTPGVLKGIHRLQEDVRTPENIQEMLRGIVRTKEISNQQKDIIERVLALQEEDVEIDVGYKRGTYMLKERPDLERRLKDMLVSGVDADRKARIERVMRYGMVSDDIVEEIEAGL